jgi:hypothetical protein
MKKLFQILADIAIGIYLVWVAVHLSLLVYYENTLVHKQGFWPFQINHFEKMHLNNGGMVAEYKSYPISSYDVTEFIFYILFPLLLAFAIMFVLRKKEIKSSTF